MFTLTWQKSSFSEPNGTNCVELAASPADGTILLRESDAPGVVLATSRARLGALLAAIKAGEFAGPA